MSNQWGPFLAYPAEEFKALYHFRWGIEENYKRLKQWVEIENFSGKSALSVRQDFYAKVLSTNLMAIVTNAAQIWVDNMSTNRKLAYQINFAQALSKMKNTIVQWLRLRPTRLRIRIEQFIRYLTCTIESVRSGRSYNRPKTKKNRIFYSAYKRARYSCFLLNLTALGRYPLID
ncbi:MAG: transposase [Gammaproteobacteria bacterium]|nr:transposase [Gammaproteobacteria bacterium]